MDKGKYFTSEKSYNQRLILCIRKGKKTWSVQQPATSLEWEWFCFFLFLNRMSVSGSYQPLIYHLKTSVNYLFFFYSQSELRDEKKQKKTKHRRQRWDKSSLSTVLITTESYTDRPNKRMCCSSTRGINSWLTRVRITTVNWVYTIGLIFFLF